MVKPACEDNPLCDGKDVATSQCSHTGMDGRCSATVHVLCSLAMVQAMVHNEDGSCRPDLSDATKLRCHAHLPSNSLIVARGIKPAHFQCVCGLVDQPTNTKCSFPSCTSTFHAVCMAGSVATLNDDPDYLGTGIYCLLHMARSSQLVQRGCHPVSYYNEFDRSRDALTINVAPISVVESVQPKDEGK